jgi:hypothetical protein
MLGVGLEVGIPTVVGQQRRCQRVGQFVGPVVLGLEIQECHTFGWVAEFESDTS